MSLQQLLDMLSAERVLVAGLMMMMMTMMMTMTWIICLNFSQLGL
jgi:hypothetical protein